MTENKSGQTYEIWGLDNTPSDWDGGPEKFRESFYTLEDAKAALSQWQSDGRAARIRIYGNDEKES